MSERKILLVIAYEGYQPIEYGVPKKILQNAGFTIITASNKIGTATAKDGSETTVDILLEEINPKDYDGIFFIGGPGALEHLDNKISYAIIKKTVHFNKPIGAICISTRILAKAGILNGRQATGWDGDGELGSIYESHNVRFMNQDIVVDDHIITATDPSVAQEFGEQIITMLQNNKGWG